MKYLKLDEIATHQQVGIISELAADDVNELDQLRSLIIKNVQLLDHPGVRVLNSLLSSVVDLQHAKFDKDLPVTQDWVHSLTLMQQSVLLTAIRGPDGRAKYEAPKMLVRWYRRCVLISAFDRETIDNPWDSRGGSFTGPSIQVGMNEQYSSLSRLLKPEVDAYLKQLDAIPVHFQRHFMHAAEILGYKHPVPEIRAFWLDFYVQLVEEIHLTPETEEEMDKRLGDNREGWLERSSDATRN